MFYFLAYLFFSLSHLEMCLYIYMIYQPSPWIFYCIRRSQYSKVLWRMKVTPFQPRSDFFKNTGSPRRVSFWVTLSLILAGFSCLRLGTDRPTKCLKIDFLYGFSHVFANYTFWTTCHKLYNVSNCLILKFLCIRNIVVVDGDVGEPDTEVLGCWAGT